MKAWFKKHYLSWEINMNDGPLHGKVKKMLRKYWRKRLKRILDKQGKKDGMG